MELHFCSQCGISIPLAEVEAGVAVAGDDRYLCSEHRPAAAPAPTGAGPGTGGASGSTGTDAESDVELLFCSNCRVSIPLSDARSGRARREFGSMLCTVCARSDPGERAARREAVESEMQADAESDDPFEAARRNVPARSEAAAREAGFGIGTLFVFGILLLGAFVATTLVLRADPLEIPDHSAELARLEDQDKALRRSVEDLTAALAARETVAPSDLDAAIARIRGELAQGTRELEAQLAGIRNELVKSDTELANRVAKVEASLESQSAQLSALYPLLQSAVERPAREGPGDEGPPAVKPPVRPTAGDSPGGKAPDPKTVDYINDLLNNPGEGVRFSAATELGKLGDPACIPALVKALSADSHFLVRRACARSLGLLKSWYACPALIEALADKEAYVAQQANYALLNITGQDFGVSQDQTVPVRRTKSKAALKWWEKNREFYPEGVDLTPSEM